MVQQNVVNPAGMLGSSVSAGVLVGVGSVLQVTVNGVQLALGDEGLVYFVLLVRVSAAPVILDEGCIPVAQEYLGGVGAKFSAIKSNNFLDLLIDTLIPSRLPLAWCCLRGRTRR